MEFWNLTEVCFGKKCLARPWLCTLSELNGAVYGTQKNKLAVNVFPGVFLGMQAARDVHIDIRKKKRRPWFLIHAPDRVYEGGVVRLQPRASSVVICVSCTDFHPPFPPLSLSLSLCLTSSLHSLPERRTSPGRLQLASTCLTENAALLFCQCNSTDWPKIFAELQVSVQSSRPRRAFHKSNTRYQSYWRYQAWLNPITLELKDTLQRDGTRSK